jgi:hypothetical protein
MVGFNMMEQINALILTNFYLPRVLHLLSAQKGGKCLDYQSNTCAHSTFVCGYLADYLCTSIYFHPTFDPNMLDSSS